MARVKNITTDDLGYKGQIFPAGKPVELPAGQAEAMAESMPDRFRLMRKSRNRKISGEGTENRTVE